MSGDTISPQNHPANYTYSFCSIAAIRALIRTFDVPACPIDTAFLRGRDLGTLDQKDWRVDADPDKHRLLRYGARYRVLQTIHPNRAGRLLPDEIVTYLGNYVFPYDNGLRLYFEYDDRRKVTLDFEGNMEISGNMTMWHTEEFDAYLECMPDLPRNTELRTLARAVLPWALSVGPTPYYDHRSARSDGAAG